MSISQAECEAYLRTVWAIADSQFVDQYLIGFTARSARERFVPYKQHGWEHIVIIADKLSRPDALKLERFIFEEAHKEKGDALYEKYNFSRRDRPYRPSWGGATGKPASLIHSVYMTWWER